MRVVIQRVTSAQVTVAEQVIGKIGTGLLLFVGIATSDTDAELDWMVKKVLELRLFPGKAGDRFDCSVQEIQGALLVVSQFTLYGDCRKGRRPSFDRAANPEIARQQYERFVEKLRQAGSTTGSTTGLTIETGQFGANMQVSLQNDGPVTLLLEREAD
jgi:D-tyrosyl-tRNA(Tyr) deacylase